MKCKYCNKRCHKCGRQANGTQKYRCKSCLKYQQEVYSSQIYNPSVNTKIIALVKEGVGIRGIGRLLFISKTTVLKRVRQIASGIKRPVRAYGKTFEIDEMWTFCRNKKNEQWITYIFDRASKTVVDFIVGRRNTESLRPMISRVLQLSPTLVATDGLRVYKSIIPNQIHSIQPYQTLRRERNNLNLRIHLKRLSRKTINFTKSVSMLKSILKIYFWS
ncbi:MAG: IS1 family transposase [Roseivirga sp.]|nr:IS1 family transposase [Roseivirga sp.]